MNALYFSMSFPFSFLYANYTLKILDFLEGVSPENTLNMEIGINPTSKIKTPKTKFKQNNVIIY